MIDLKNYGTFFDDLTDGFPFYSPPSIGCSEGRSKIKRERESKLAEPRDVRTAFLVLGNSTGVYYFYGGIKLFLLLVENNGKQAIITPEMRKRIDNNSVARITNARVKHLKEAIDAVRTSN